MTLQVVTAIYESARVGAPVEVEPTEPIVHGRAA